MPGPLAAERELRDNPNAHHDLVAANYIDATRAVEAWEKMDIKDKRQSKPPKGKMVELVHKHRAEVLRGR